MLIDINPSSAESLGIQIIRKIKEMIENGSLLPGTELPSSRKLAEKLGISRSTVYHAYCELQAMGYLRSKQGSYNIVQKRKREVNYDPERASVICWDKISSPNAQAAYSDFLEFSPKRNLPVRPENKLINLEGLVPDSRLFPITEFKRSMNYALQNTGAEGLVYGTVQGYLPLREYLAKRLRLHSISVSADEILITNGAQQAIDLILTFFASAKISIAVESPTYSLFMPLLKLHQMKAVWIPMKSEGMDLDSLSKVLSEKKADIVYTMPNFHNPTGITTSHQHRERLLQLCLKHNVPLIEDGFEEDLKYFGKVDLPIKSLDEGNSVIYLGTFSKALFPGLRLGWIAASKELTDRLTAIRRFTDLGTNHISQIAMHFFCENGYYDMHLKKLYRIYRRRMEIALRTMEACFPKSVSWTKPVGGYLIWVKMPKKLSKSDLCLLLDPFGIKVSSGTYYFPETRESEFFRISISALNEEEIIKGITSLGKALSRL